MLSMLAIGSVVGTVTVTAAWLLRRPQDAPILARISPKDLQYLCEGRSYLAALWSDLQTHFSAHEFSHAAS